MSNIKIPLAYNQELIQKNTYWSNVISEWQSSSMSPSVFCSARQISRQQFHYWRRKICPKNKIELNTDQTQPSNFIEIPTKLPAIETSCDATKTSKPLLLKIVMPNKIPITIEVPVTELINIINQLGVNNSC